jgi:hypothetical protein
LQGSESFVIRPSIALNDVMDVGKVAKIMNLNIGSLDYNLEAAYLHSPDLSSLFQFTVNFTKKITQSININLFMNYEISQNKQENLQTTRRRATFSIDWVI